MMVTGMDKGELDAPVEVTVMFRTYVPRASAERPAPTQVT
jgi:hypothetical protein